MAHKMHSLKESGVLRTSLSGPSCKTDLVRGVILSPNSFLKPWMGSMIRWTSASIAIARRAFSLHLAGDLPSGRLTGRTGHQLNTKCPSKSTISTVPLSWSQIHFRSMTCNFWFNSVGQFDFLKTAGYDAWHWTTAVVRLSVCTKGLLSPSTSTLYTLQISLKLQHQCFMWKYE